MPRLEDKLSASISQADEQKGKTEKQAASGKGGAKKAGAPAKAAGKKADAQAAAKKKASGAARGRQSGHVQAGSLASRQVWPD